MFKPLEPPAANAAANDPCGGLQDIALGGKGGGGGNTWGFGLGELGGIALGETGWREEEGGGIRCKTEPCKVERPRLALSRQGHQFP
jgi:hypothetical protein